ncbi:MAG: M1 family aminopeptidase [Thermomicrobiales bacterium]
MRTHPERCVREGGQWVSWSILLPGLMLAIMAGSGLPSTAGRAAPIDAIDQYALDVTFDPEARTVVGSMSVEWVNDTGQSQEALYLRLYPNADHYVDGQIAVSSVTLDDQPVAATFWPDATVLEVAFLDAIAPGEDVELALRFVTTVPVTSGASFGILGGEPETGWWLADWYPILAGWEAGSGWYLDPPTRFGDPTFAESATYELTFVTQDEYLVIGSGETTGVTANEATGMVTTTVSTGPARDLTLSLLPESDATPIESLVRDIAGISVRVSLPDDEAMSVLTDAILSIASETLPLYEAWLGPYPDRELDFTTVPLAGASGVSWSGLVWLDLGPIVADGRLAAAEWEQLRFILAHELSHQWIAGIVGSNNNDHGFMSEGLANALSVLAIRDVAGIEEAERSLREQVASGYRTMLESGGDGIADATITDDTDMAARSRLVYGKAALGFEAIRQDIGNASFFAGLAAYADDYRFAISTPDDLRRAFEEASGTNLESLWSFWFEERATTTADVDAVLDGFAGT